MLKRFVAFLIMLQATTTVAFGYNYVTPDQFQQWLESGKKMVIVDIQVSEGFKTRHFKHALETNAYPVKSDAEKQRLDAALEKISASQDEVVIVCPRGGGGAKNAFDYLEDKGVAEKRLFILEKGMEGWPYPALCEAGK
jgi:rhodanese-related sulfurtransferase